MPDPRACIFPKTSLAFRHLHVKNYCTDQLFFRHVALFDIEMKCSIHRFDDNGSHCTSFSVPFIVFCSHIAVNRTGELVIYISSCSGELVELHHDFSNLVSSKLILENAKVPIEIFAQESITVLKTEALLALDEDGCYPILINTKDIHYLSLNDYLSRHLNYKTISDILLIKGDSILIGNICKDSRKKLVVAHNDVAHLVEDPSMNAMYLDNMLQIRSIFTSKPIGNIGMLSGVRVIDASCIDNYMFLIGSRQSSRGASVYVFDMNDWSMTSSYGFQQDLRKITLGKTNTGYIVLVLANKDIVALKYEKDEFFLLQTVFKRGTIQSMAFNAKNMLLAISDSFDGLEIIKIDCSLETFTNIGHSRQNFHVNDIIWKSECVAYGINISGLIVKFTIVAGYSFLDTRIVKKVDDIFTSIMFDSANEKMLIAAFSGAIYALS